jgi:hypothetical protein
MSQPIVHLAGTPVAIRMPDGTARAIQRCLICGRKLGDSLGAVAPDGEDQFTPWAPGAWVEEVAVSEHITEYTKVGLSDSPNNLFDTPDNCCVILVEN